MSIEKELIIFYCKVIVISFKYLLILIIKNCIYTIWNNIKTFWMISFILFELLFNDMSATLDLYLINQYERIFINKEIKLSLIQLFQNHPHSR